jgi:hypothetical protein
MLHTLSVFSVYRELENHMQGIEPSPMELQIERRYHYTLNVIRDSGCCRAKKKK